MQNNDTDTEARRQGVGPVTVGVALVSVAIVAALLIPLDAVARTWTVRALLVLWALGIIGFALGGRLVPARVTRRVRVAFQTVFFWGFMSGALFALPLMGHVEPGAAVVRGAISALLFGAIMWALDRWTGERQRA